MKSDPKTKKRATVDEILGGKEFPRRKLITNGDVWIPREACGKIHSAKDLPELLTEAPTIRPAGTLENSPPFQRWDNARNKPTESRGDETKMHSFTSCYLHVVFSTKERRRLITPALQQRLWPYLGGIARESKMKALCIGGVEDHVHILLSLPSTLSISKAVQLLKGNSSKWIHETFSAQRDFTWQEGYGAFSIGVSGVDDTVKYIESQPEHHQTRTFKEELVAFLKSMASNTMKKCWIDDFFRPCRDLFPLALQPTVETVGYCRASLRDCSAEGMTKWRLTAMQGRE